MWRRNAFYGETQTFDSCVGHQPQSGDYHYHANPLCLRAQLGDNITVLRTTRTGSVYQESTAPWKPSPILGWAIDGYPIYGPYGYSDPTSASSAVKRIKSGFRLRSITARTSLPDWSLPNHTGISQQLTTAQYGPDITTLYPVGRYLEDYEWVQSIGDLDAYNGRFEVTPEYPQGTYAYHITIDDTGTPAFPYILAGQYYGSPTGGKAQTIASDAIDYFNAGATTALSTSTPQITSWATKSYATQAQAISGYDPSAGASTTWPTNVPAGATFNGGVRTAANGDTQRVRYSGSSVYVNANGLASYTMGPWFDSGMTGGVFQNFPGNQNYQFQFPRLPAAATSRTSTGGGAVGLWVNGVAVFNFIDGASYSNTSKTDSGGGGVTPTAVQLSAASLEQGPLAAGSIAAAFPLFGATLAASTATAPTPDWPVTLGGGTVAVKDSKGVTRQATMYYASPSQVNYRLPADTATGFGTVTFTANGTSWNANINVAASYPGLFLAAADATASGYVVRVRAGQSTIESITQPISQGPVTDQVFLVLYGSGLGTANSATATVGGASATVAYAGAQGTYQGVDQYNILLPRPVSGRVAVVVTAAGRAANTVFVTVQ